MSQRPKTTKKKASKDADRAGPSQSSSAASRRQQEDLEDMDHEDATQTQSNKIAQRNFDQMDAETRKRKISEIVRYLVCAQGRMGTPVKRKELSDKVMGPEYSRSLPIVLEHANDKLKEVFGLEIREVVKGKVKSIILVNLLPPTITGEFLKWSKLDKAHLGLLSVVLSLIMMKQGKISEEHLWSCLGRLGLSRDGAHHSTFGDVDRLISKDFVDQMYLSKEKQIVGDSNVITYRWGPRADEEVDRRNLMRFAAEVYGANVDVWERHLSAVSNGQTAQ